MEHCKKDSFFASPYDEGTLLKLKIFSGYMREWIPVFFTQRKNEKIAQPSKIKFYDFFAGAGSDEHGTPGTPLLLLKEIKNYCKKLKDSRKKELEPSILFNDSNPEHINLLKNKIDSIKCKDKCCNIRFTVNKFHESLKNELPEMQKNDTACLAIMDQYGLKEITKEVLALLSSCPKIDFMFFISSSYIYRFSEQTGIKELFDLKKTDHSSVHRAVCDYYKSLIPDSGMYFAPFSIRKKNGNIYGIIFGTHNLYGLEKFLRVCWNHDEDTGEANYDIDNDGDLREGQLYLFEKKTKKLDKFEKELLDFIQQGKKMTLQTRDFIRPVTNIDIYRFTLEHGFLPKHANKIIQDKLKKKELLMLDRLRNKIEKHMYLYLKHDIKVDDEHLRYILPIKTEQNDRIAL